MERGMKIRPIPRGIEDGNPRGGNPSFGVQTTFFLVCVRERKFFENVKVQKLGLMSIFPTNICIVGKFQDLPVIHI